MKITHFARLLACTLSLTLVLPISDGRGDNPTPMLRSKPTVVAQVTGPTVGRFRPGGVRICLPEDWANIRVREISRSDSGLVATLDGDMTLSVANDPAVLKSLVAVVAQDRDDCIEVSIDVVGRIGLNYYASDGMESSSLVAERLLALDSELDSLYGGEYRLSETQLGSARLPQEEARRLVSATHVTSDYRDLALRYPIPPVVSHTTTMRLQKHDHLSVTWDVHLSPVFQSPTGQWLYATGAEEAAAILPYMPLVQRFESAPQEFRETVTQLEHGMNIARAYGLLSACQKRQTPACLQLFKDIAALPENTESQEADAAASDDSWSAAKDNHLTKVWQQYRDSIDHKQMNPEQRIAFAVDEALARYRDLEVAQAQSLRTGITPQAILDMTSDVDLDRARYGGWGHLARFLAMVWSDASFAETVDALQRAYQRSQETDDVHLRYQVLRSVRELLPVIASKLYVAERTGTSPRSGNWVQVSFDPGGQLRAGVRMGPLGYLRYLDRTIDGAIQEHVKERFQQISQKAQAHVKGDPAHLRLRETQLLLYEFQRSHITDEKAAVDDEALDDLIASLHYSIGMAAINENDLSLSQNHLRMLHSLQATNRRAVAWSKKRYEERKKGKKTEWEKKREENKQRDMQRDKKEIEEQTRVIESTQSLIDNLKRRLSED